MKKTKNDKYITITRRKGDYSLLFSVILLSVVGTVFIYSASRYSALSTYNDSLYFVKKQIIGILLGIAAMIFTSFYNYNKLKKFTIPVSIIAFVLLCLVFVPGIGVENYGAKRWIGFGGFTLQPSEIAKFALILFTASYVSGNPDKIKTFVGILPVLVVGGIICLLIILEPNMSITICTVLLLFGLLFAAGMKIKHFAFLIIPAFLGGVALIFLEPYRINRLLAFIDPWANPKGEGYQLLQSLYALGSGGWFGVGLFNSRQKYAFLPFAESDFILSVIGEEIGFIGVFFFFALLIFIIVKGIMIASKAENVFGFMLATGVTLIFGIQVIINALVVTGSIPPTGLPLPLVSSGNTSIIIFMAEMGVLFNISKKTVIV
ncbi:MAG: putative lipid II flippase FtsW [Candidatus Borkfalkiaceae bacterium]|nr:putative lipid II flippase FtsW [Christensenellaceae bacterium]